MRSAAGKYEFSKHILLVGLDLAPLRFGARGACPFRPPLDPPLVARISFTAISFTRKTVIPLARVTKNKA